MDEAQQAQAQGETQARATFNPPTGNQSTADVLLEKARQERDFLIKENERMERNIASLKELEATRLLSGTAGGRMADEIISEEEMARRKSLDFWKGTAIADAIIKTNG